MAKTKMKHPGGRPTKFDANDLRAIKILVEKGFTDEEVANTIKVTSTTYHNWKKKNPEFFESLKEWKAIADKKVEVSLYERAKGYSHSDEKIFNDNGTEMRVKTTKHYPPDPTSMIFWLKNRQPEKWRDTQHVDVTSNGNTILDKIRAERNK